MSDRSAAMRMAGKLPENRQTQLVVPNLSISGIKISHRSLALAACFVAMVILSYFPRSFDYPVTLFVNRVADGNKLPEIFAYDICHFYTTSGILFLCGVWYCWFSSPRDTKSRILVGVAAAFAAGMISRFLQHKIPSHDRPLHDPMLQFHLPSVVDPHSLSEWYSFPSDHAAVWFGLATVILLARPGLGVAALVWAFVTNAARNYLGYHYPTDIIAGAALGALLVWLSQMEWPQLPGRWLVAWGERHTALFYTLALFLSFQVATLFDDLRQIAGGIGKATGLRLF
jgi:undecaprenyl-diphosphatase